MDFKNFEYLKYSRIYFIIAIIFVIFSVSMFFSKINLGIDMTGGISLEYSYEGEINIDNLKEKIGAEKENFLYNGKKVVNNTNVYKTTGENSLTVVAGFIEIGDEKELDNLKSQFRNKALEVLKKENNTIEETRYTNIGKAFGDYIKESAYLTLGLAIIGIFIYVYFAFSGSVSGISGYSFGLITLLTLTHDVLIAAGIYIFVGKFYQDFQVDIYFVTALLTILGYSINDTIVIFDRIRENLKAFGGKTGKHGKTLYEIVNLSVFETFKRSIYTSVTLIFVLVTIFFFGPETLKGFIFVMLIGTIVGTYSSIFLASPILYLINKNKKLSVYKEKVYNPDDKIVV